MAGSIFFSYARADGEFALKLATGLRNAGMYIWIDQLDIHPGKVWDLEIEKALENAQYILCIFSDNSTKSNNVLNEVYYALDENKEVIPVIISQCSIPFRLRRLQYVDFTKDYETAFNNLLSTLDTAKTDASASGTSTNPNYSSSPKKNSGQKTYTRGLSTKRKWSATRIILVIIAAILILFGFQTIFNTCKHALGI
jgi:hypothetical protein